MWRKETVFRLDWRVIQRPSEEVCHLLVMQWNWGRKPLDAMESYARLLNALSPFEGMPGFILKQEETLKYLE